MKKLNKENSLVSVLLATYNHQDYVKQTIKSLINQTYQNIELIIIDDGSTDNTWLKVNEIKKICKKRFVNLILKKQQNQGIVTTENRLLNLAKGQYCYFIDSDDMAKPDAIFKLHDFLSQNKDFVLVTGDNEYIDKKSKLFFLDKNRKHTYNKTKALYKTRGESLQNVRTDIDFTSSAFGKYSSLIKENYIQNGFLVRTKAIRQIGGFKKAAPVYEYYLALQLSKYSKFKYINEVLYSYRCHSNNTLITPKFVADYFIKTMKYELNLIKNIHLTNNLTYDAKTCIKNKFAQFVLSAKIEGRKGMLHRYKNNTNKKI